MKKTILITSLVAILAITLVSAWQIDYKERCDVVRPATEFRPEKVYPGIGVWGVTVERFGNTYYRTLTCFVPDNGGSHKKKSNSQTSNPPDTCEPTTIEICNDVEVCNPFRYESCENVKKCHEECHREKVWKKTCNWKCGKMHCEYGWVWEKVCKNVCHTVKECEWLTEPNCHTEEKCHEEKRGCEA